MIKELKRLRNQCSSTEQKRAFNKLVKSFDKAPKSFKWMDASRVGPWVKGHNQVGNEYNNTSKLKQLGPKSKALRVRGGVYRCAYETIREMGGGFDNVAVFIARYHTDGVVNYTKGQKRTNLIGDADEAIFVYNINGTEVMIYEYGILEPKYYVIVPASFTGEIEKMILDNIGNKEYW